MCEILVFIGSIFDDYGKMNDPLVKDGFPSNIPDPLGYYQGLDEADRIISRNVIVFERLTRRTLQQKHLSNRMHHRYVLMRVLKTNGIVSIDGKSFALKEGDTLLVAPHQFHHYVDLDLDDLRWIFITFELQQGRERLDELTYRTVNNKAVIDKLWAGLVSEWVESGAGERKSILPMLDLLLVSLLSDESRASRTTPAVSNEWIAKVEGLIAQSVKTGWTLDEVAERMGLSGRHLRNLFEKQMGVSLRDYRANYQLHRAIALMGDSKRSLSEVAELSGFHSQSVFTRFIRRMTDKTPRDLKREIVGMHLS